MNDLRQLRFPSLMAAKSLIGGLLVLATVMAAPGKLSAQEATQEAVVIEFEGMITPILEQFFYRKLNQAKKMGASVVILQIDSPGGYVISSKNIAETLRDIEWARTVAYVKREALSGAAIVSLGADDIVMFPTARIGDAGPIIEGEDSAFRHAPEKIVSDLATFVRTISESQQHPPSVAEAMVDKNVELFFVEHAETGETRVMSEAELKETDPGTWMKGKPIQESQKGRFLEVNGARAVTLGLAIKTVESDEELHQFLQLDSPPTVLRTTSVDWAVEILNWHIVTGLLFLIGLIALFVEFSAPGIGVGGLIAGLCFTLFFWSRFLGGTSGWLEVILFFLGVVFIAVEIFIIPGFGVAGISGILLVLSSILMASIEGHIPQNQRSLQTVGMSLLVFFSAGGIGILLAMLYGHHFGSMPVMRHLVLQPPEELEESTVDGKAIVAPDLPYGVGDWGTADTPLRPAGRALFGDDYVDVVADGTFVDAGKNVRIVSMSGNRIVVREVADRPA